MAIVDVVKYDGDMDTFAWKFPNNALSTKTQLIVNESQEAVLLKGGQACDIFGPGHYVLETANIPLVSKMMYIPFGGETPFSAEVWYVNKVYSPDIKWQTETPIQLLDAKFNIPISVTANGQFGIRIADSKKFLLRLVGTLKTLHKDNIKEFFRGLYMSRVKDLISKYCIKNNISILQLNSLITELSEQLHENMQGTFEKYGIELINFYIEDISVKDDLTMAVIKSALAKRAEMDIVGYGYAQERSFDVLEGAANNQAAGQSGMLGAGMGLAMGVGMGNTVGQQFGGLANGFGIGNPKVCSDCHRNNAADAVFCAYCGKPLSVAKIKCSKCEAEIDTGAKFCPQCGNKLGA
ncbi:MAG: SPFH domain-containing protein [Synergistaceae bacterium]|nr:SPFH domain-containing protein [Candidatus Equadaptatus faecalis]